LCLENTHNRCGGAALTPEYTAKAAKIAHYHGLKVHLDGARIFNASVALGVPAAELAKDADSVCFCLSKGLSAPVGSVLCGKREFVEQARKRRKMLGGGMRQAGVIAAAGIVALETMIGRLAEDHANARILASGLASIQGITLAQEKVMTNIVMFDAAVSPLVCERFIEQLDEKGVKIGSRGGNSFRAVTNRMVNAQDIDYTLLQIEAVMRELR
jgi:threonine aldolase